jgi:hypothetical protein
MSNITKILFIIGSVLTVCGSFLPWQSEGDFLSYWSYGIRLSPSFRDNGGLLIVVLSIMMIVLVFLPPVSFGNPKIWNIVFGTVLVLDTTFYIIKWLVNRKDASGIVGAPVIQIGLIMVAIGSTILLLTAVLYFIQSPR